MRRSKPTTNHPISLEDGLREKVETYFSKSRDLITCPACKFKGAITLSSAKGHRRFQCRCNRSWSCKTFSATFMEGEGEDNSKENTIILTESDDSTFSESSSPPPKRPAMMKNSKIEKVSELETKVSQLESVIKNLIALLTNSAPTLVPALTSILETTLSPNNNHDQTNKQINQSTLPFTLSLNAPSASLSSPPLLSSAASIPSRKTYADMARELNCPTSDIPIFAESRNAIRFVRSGYARTPGTKLSNSNFNLRTNLIPVYASGFGRMPLSKLKTHLFNMRFALSKIANLSFIGNSTLEFLVTSDYKETLTNRLRTLEFKILESFDPSKALAPGASLELQEKVKNAAIRRIQIIFKSSLNPAVKNFCQLEYKKLTGTQLPIVDSKLELELESELRSNLITRTETPEAVLIDETIPMTEAPQNLSVAPQNMIATLQNHDQ